MIMIVVLILEINVSMLSVVMDGWFVFILFKLLDLWYFM